MKISDYRAALESARKAAPSSGHFVNCGALAKSIETAIWHLQFRQEAAELAHGFRAEEARSASAAGCA